MKLLTDGQRDWLISGWKTRFVRLNEAEREEVQQTLDVMFMPHIKPYLEIYSAGGGFSSLPSLRGGLGAVIQGTLHTETEEPVVDELSVVRAPYSMVTSEGTSSDVNTSSSEVNARSSELLDLSSSTTPLQSLLGITSADELQLEDGGLEDTNPGFFDEALAAPDYCGL